MRPEQSKPSTWCASSIAPCISGGEPVDTMQHHNPRNGERVRPRRLPAPTGGAVTPVIWMLLVSAAVVLSGCASTPLVDDPFEFDDERGAGAEFSAWFDGGDVDIDDARTAEHLWVGGEAAYWRGNFNEAYDYYTAMLRDHPGHGLNRYAAQRLGDMGDDVVNFYGRIREDLGEVRFDDESALTRVELARLAHATELDEWSGSELAEPFATSSTAFVSAWRATPMLSPWGALDFDEPMAPEESEKLSESYRSPAVAGADPANWEDTRTVASNQLRQRHRLGGSGIYYLEGQLSVDADPEPEVDGPREMTISARFPGAARVWIGDTEVLEWRDEGYEPGRLLRQVELEPGDHRVLVKLAYEPGAGNGFELLGVPTSGSIFGDAGLETSPDVEGPSAGTELAGEMRRATELEPVQLGSERLEDVDSQTVYAGALSAYLSGDFERFSVAFDALMERHPEFTPGYLVGSRQVQTRSDLTSEQRQARSLSKLRQAQQLDPDNLYALVRLADHLRDHGSDAEYRQVLERGRDLAAGASPEPMADADMGGRGDVDGMNGGEEAVRHLRPLIHWAQYLERQGWYREAEAAWHQVLDVEPRNCRAMRRLQSLYGARNAVVEPGELSPSAQRCPSVIDNWLGDDPQRLEERLELAKRQAARYPYHERYQLDTARLLEALDRRPAAVEIVEELLESRPWSGSVWQRRIELALSDGDDETARELIDASVTHLGRSEAMQNQRARLDGEIPLESMLRDGRQAALDEVQSTGEQAGVAEDDERERAMVLDDAYYVVDFAADRYFEDGSSWTLTHQITRVMSRGAIEDYAELSIPSGADLLLARTIKEDGEVRVPDGVSGDSTLSMPGLSPGDMVEVAYLEFQPASRIGTRIDGNRFYFQMPNISSRHSEYVGLDDGDLEFESANGAPEPESMEVDGIEGVRFVAEDIRRPRSESRRVSSQEYLPWVREYRRGVDGHMLDFERSYMRNAIAQSAKMAPAVEDKFEEWIGTSMDDVDVDDELVRQLFYDVTQWFRQPTPGAFSTDAVHAIEQRQGSPVVVLHLALSELEVDHDIFAARTDEQPPQAQEVGELGRYSRAIMRIEMPDSGDVFWIKPDRRDAMFGAIEPELDGQQAICLTCNNYVEQTVELDEELLPRRHIELEGRLEETGTLQGTLRIAFDGVRAARVRSALRSRSDDVERRDYMERVLTGQISGATLVDFDLSNEDEPSQSMVLELEFERPGFARLEEGELVVDRMLFQEAMQGLYARQSTRETPLFVGYERRQSVSAAIELPEAEDVRLRADNVDALSSRFGDFERRSWVDDGVLRLETSIDLWRQRIEADAYPEFREWARTVEESAALWLAVESVTAS